jgi:hypothetical protein
VYSRKIKKIKKDFKRSKKNQDPTTSEDVKRLWSEHLQRVLPPCPWTALWKPAESDSHDGGGGGDDDDSGNKFVDVVKVGP